MSDKTARSLLVKLAEHVHMAGQHSAGVDPSYSEARAYGTDILSLDVANEIIQQAAELSQELQEKREEVEVLRLYVERLRGSLLDALNHLAMSEKSQIEKSKAVEVLNEAFLKSQPNPQTTLRIMWRKRR